MLEAFPKYGLSQLNSGSNKVVFGSEVEWYMLNFPTTSKDRVDFVKIVDGGTER
jgi:hypothetical protein